jgi:hypothetical protein
MLLESLVVDDLKSNLREVKIRVKLSIDDYKILCLMSSNLGLFNC